MQGSIAAQDRGRLKRLSVLADDYDKILSTDSERADGTEENTSGVSYMRPAPITDTGLKWFNEEH